jgi:curved DNA-binding protein CbpA
MCARKVQCPRCHSFASCSTRGDAEVLRHTAAFFAALNSSPGDDSEAEAQESQDVCARLQTFLAQESDAIKKIECEAQNAANLEKSHRDGLHNEDLVSKLATKAYRKLSLRAHPDHGGTSQGFQSLNDAYETLRVVKKRLEYNATSHHAFVLKLQKEREGAYSRSHSDWRERCNYDRHRYQRQAIEDPRPPQASTPILELTPTQEGPLHGWRIKCSWRSTRGAGNYIIRMRGPDTDDWLALGSAGSSLLERCSPLIMATGHYEVVCIARNSYGDGPASEYASIFVPGAATVEELREQRRAQEEAEAAEKLAYETRRARTNERAARRHLQDHVTKLRAALQDVAECDGEQKDHLAAALWELRNCLERMKANQPSSQDEGDLVEEAEEILSSQKVNLFV